MRDVVNVMWDCFFLSVYRAVCSMLANGLHSNCFFGIFAL